MEYNAVRDAGIDIRTLDRGFIAKEAREQGYESGYRKGKREFNAVSYFAGHAAGTLSVLIGYFIGGLQ